MATPITYRAAVENDVATIAKLLTELNHSEGSDNVVDEMALAGGLFARDRRMDLAALLAVQGEKTVAAALYYPGYDVLTTSYGYHLADIVVAKNYRRRGIGRSLLAHLAAQNLAQGGEWISLTVLSKNKTAHAFYQSLNLNHVPVEFFAAGKKTLIALAGAAGK